MQRDIYKQLLDWKEKESRKPLILNGARQVGKTYILRKFGEQEYQKFAFFSLDRNLKVREVFEKGESTADIIMALSAISQVDITPGDTLVVLDEIQDCPKALEALKFFCEETPDIHIIVAGSLLGLSLHNGVSYPVGKVEELRLYPMSFLEFLNAMNKTQLLSILKSKNWTVINMLEKDLISLLRQYYYVGGMPAAVLAHAEQKGLQEVRSIQQQILADYRRDFSKHAPAREVPRINMVWDSIPAQLAKDNKKFIYGAVKKSARAVDFEMGIQWLIDAGLAYKVIRVNAPRLPLKFYEDTDAFKLFMLDVGLMGAMTETPAEAMLVGDNVFSEYKGAFTELYVFTQLKALGMSLYYHSISNSTIEIDFLTQHHGKVVPIEVKAEVNVKSKSLRTFITNNPELKAVRFSMLPYKEQDWMTNIPLYACMVGM
ncbi:ATP-binding protein [Leyella stercorea]|uniref:ATP-binding protein n=1 Tax=Leyella stercorea TaxID=363265 RepID=UPI001F1E0E51|nr:ATP-binding protein [Leyella stercorea]MCF2614286.1 ATP-binding protein [Leyella stercorea]